MATRGFRISRATTPLPRVEVGRRKKRPPEAKTVLPEPVARRKKEEEKKKLTFKEKQEYASLEGEIEQLEAEKDAIGEQLSSGTLPAEELMSQSNGYRSSSGSSTRKPRAGWS